MNYIIVEIQKDATGGCANLIQTATNRNEAESKYHGILQYAAISTLPIHSVVLLDEAGNFISKQSYYHFNGSESEGEDNA